MDVSTAASCWKGTLIVGSLLCYLAAVALNAYFNIPGISPFNETIGDLSHKYSTPITPSDSTFAIWGVIYIWQLVVTIYCTTLMCRSCYGKPLYVFPGVVPTIFFVSYIVNLIGNPGWIYVWLEERLLSALLLLVIGVLTLLICLASSCAELTKSGHTLEKSGHVADIWCTRIIVQNGIAFYLAWVSCATAINLVVVLHYMWDVAMDTSCYVALSCITVFLVCWVAAEYAFDREMRYIFSHYLTYITAFVGIYTEHFDANVGYEIFVLVLLIAVAVLALIKLIVMVVRGITDPIHYPKQADKVKFQPLVEDLMDIKKQ